MYVSKINFLFKRESMKIAREEEYEERKRKYDEREK